MAPRKWDTRNECPTGAGSTRLLRAAGQTCGAANLRSVADRRRADTICGDKVPARARSAVTMDATAGAATADRGAADRWAAMVVTDSMEAVGDMTCEADG